ncbi:MAG TPA: hypothetical protein DIW23_07655 [Anaerolineae bacterium]|nr:hypothetical protein [Anaerolineae bacterium]HCK66863.1 hypothetical protein [Anaerolineae bacterium]HCR71300.1 hypothetical protein [Anaerolineae bacterium]
MSNYRRNPLGDGIRRLWNSIAHNREINRGAAFGGIIIGALIAFEIFNFSATQHALQDMLGTLSFGGFKWATILAIAFCGIDFAGIARIFTPEQGRDEPAEVYYLFGAWLLAAGFNAILIWWSVSVAIANNGGIQGTTSISGQALAQGVPIFVAAMVWLIRVLIIGTISLAGDRLFTTAASHQSYQPRQSYNNNSQSRPSYQSQSYQRPVNQPSNQPILRPASQINRPVNSNSFRPAPKPVSSQQSSFIPPEPTYHPLSYDARNSDNNGDRRYDA